MQSAAVFPMRSVLFSHRPPARCCSNHITDSSAPGMLEGSIGDDPRASNLPGRAPPAPDLRTQLFVGIGTGLYSGGNAEEEQE
ncbi:hypothetical protein GCM10027562_29060 [Arthrobacter pigmenti]